MPSDLKRLKARSNSSPWTSNPSSSRRSLNAKKVIYNEDLEAIVADSVIAVDDRFDGCPALVEVETLEGAAIRFVVGGLADDGLAVRDQDDVALRREAAERGDVFVVDRAEIAFVEGRDRRQVFLERRLPAAAGRGQQGDTQGAEGQARFHPHLLKFRVATTAPWHRRTE